MHFLTPLVFLFSAVPSVRSLDSYQPCPLLGPRFPLPTGLPTSKPLQAALMNLTAALDALSTGDSHDFTATTNTTSFSVALFSSDPLSNASSPFFYQYHHTASNSTAGPIGVREVNADSVYNVARITSVFTVYAFLVAAGDTHWLDPITKHVPELAASEGSQPVESVKWEDVRLIDLASNMAGIGRDATLDSLSNKSVPKALASILPTKNQQLISTFSKNHRDFLKLMAKRRPVNLPSSTPTYSNAAFQLLALAVENINRKPFNTTFDQSFLQPLNMRSSTLGAPNNTKNAVIPTNETVSGWADGRIDESTALAANFMYSTVTDLSKAGRAILRSELLSQVSTNRWLKPVSQTSNAADDIGAPFSIYRATLTGKSTGALVPIYTQFGAQGLYSSYFGLAPDWGVGFAILSADTAAPADLNAHADLISTYLLPALEKSAIQQAFLNYAGTYNFGDSKLLITIDGLSGLSLTNWTSGSKDLRAAFAELYSIPSDTLDFRLYATNLVDQTAQSSRKAFRAVLQDIAAPIDAGTPTCITWMDSLDKFVYNGVSLDEFVFELDEKGMAIGLDIPALNMTLKKGN
ncbi:beta-lactamase/transpeptidase-like protein [Eremomyces bilateralis CBS 781.70]|uniref:Beta-lactamase/transpeptidase-like protein n=1 Tax=Eremomyces bilateralis CBS 781.70 TaxID=1392243 RepID=A0A6G1FVZ8_9PEZI|nr:beta-lactamase/transpeptidase-like protein [Eremomyces bilateralis CBS 781.70]KAF1809860.1 beta-lactamase/transpeptidase-like protein [Eremomyces bilateralis CBS 781.70]